MHQHEIRHDFPAFVVFSPETRRPAGVQQAS
jgi:hypothetical protein